MGNDYANICRLKTFGLSKAVFEESIKGLNIDGAVIDFTEKSLLGVITIAKKNVDNIAITAVLSRIKLLFDKFIYTDTDDTLNKLLVNKLKNDGKMLSTAESITGGLIASKICEINGASQVLYEGLVTYNSAAKVRRLHVPAQVIELETAVSEPVCKAMLNGILANKEITYAIATTGYASDMSDMNGLAFVGYGTREEQRIEQVKFVGKRNDIREQVANFAIFNLYKFIMNDNSF